MSAAELEITVTPAGRLAFIYDDSLAGLLDEGRPSVRRASHVEPTLGGWSADLSPVGGPILGPFRLRSEALIAEAEWLKENWL